MGTIHINLLIRVFLIWVVVRESEGQYFTDPTSSTAHTEQPHFDPTRKHSFRDPETAHRDISWHFREWNKFYRGANFLGFLYAGKAEFPWIVHIRSTEKVWLSETFSIGNLVSTSHVMTVCRAVTRFKCLGPADPKCVGQADCPCRVDPEKYVEIPDVSKMSVFYFGSFIAEENLVPGGNQELKFADDFVLHVQRSCLQRLLGDEVVGNKDVAHVLLHPLCGWSTRLVFDLALVILAQDIPNYSSWLSFIPLPKKKGYIFDNKRTEFINEQKVICYVATIGSFMKGIPYEEKMIQNHKIKYRVYPTTWDRCEEWTEHSVICRGAACTSYKESHKYPPKDLRVECWETKNRIGAVCDHDRGAPVVCNGTVEGLVIRAALPDYCNAGTHVVFMVQRVGERDIIPALLIPDIFPTEYPGEPRSASGRWNPFSYSIIVFLYYYI